MLKRVKDEHREEVKQMKLRLETEYGNKLQQAIENLKKECEQLRD